MINAEKEKIHDVYSTQQWKESSHLLWLCLGPDSVAGFAGARAFALRLVNPLDGPMKEELGWRGYALPKLLTHYSALAASLLIGVAWGSLHLALLLPGMMNAGVPPLPTLLSLVGGSVIFTWLYVHSGGNIVLTTIFHASQSFFVILNDGIGLHQQMWLMAGVYLAVALFIVLFSGRSLVGQSWRQRGILRF